MGSVNPRPSLKLCNALKTSVASRPPRPLPVHTRERRCPRPGPPSATDGYGSRSSQRGKQAVWPVIRLGRLRLIVAASVDARSARLDRLERSERARAKHAMRPVVREDAVRALLDPVAQAGRARGV